MTSDDRRAPRPLRGFGGIVHSYQKYDPKAFPSPLAEPPDMASAAMEHMLMYGSTRRLTPEELARAVKLDVSQIAGLGPSLEAMMRKLLERKRQILETYETDAAEKAARRALDDAARSARPTDDLWKAFARAVREEQIYDLERLYYRIKDDTSPFAQDLVGLIERMGEKQAVEELAAKWEFTGRTEMDVPTALEVKEELEAIDRLLEQIQEAMKNAQVGIIDLEELSRFAQEAEVDQLRDMARHIQEHLREEAERQGIEAGEKGGMTLSPKAMRIFQSKVLREIFDSLQAARSGRHTGPIVGEGAVETAKTRAFEFGDSAAHLDVGQSVLNAAARAARRGGAGRASMDDLEVTLTKNTPKCATAVLMDMSGSMRYEGQYVHVKRMALALDALIRSEYPGDHLSYFEMASFAKPKRASEIAGLMPKPVTTRSPVVRLKADMGSGEVTEIDVPPHFTNIQHGLRLARRVLGAQDTPNRQVIVLTDGLPTAHFEGPELFLLYPPDARTEEMTMREARLCSREGITINLFLLPSWSQTSEDVAFAHRLAESTGGRVFFTAGSDVDRFVLWDYVSMRRKVIG